MSYYWDDFNTGDEFQTEKITIQKELVSDFANATGDNNPIHMEQTVPRDQIFDQPIAHGMLIMSLFVGQNRKLGILKGTSLGVVEVSWKFKKPVHVGDTIFYSMKVFDKVATSHPERGILKREVSTINQAGEVTCIGYFVNLVKRRSSMLAEGDSQDGKCNSVSGEPNR